MCGNTGAVPARGTEQIVLRRCLHIRSLRQVCPGFLPFLNYI